MAKAKRRLKKVRPRLISLCPAGANQAEVIFKDEDGNDYERVEAIAKMDDEGYLNVLIYMPEEVAGADSQGDVASGMVVKDACHSFIPGMTGSGIDIMHDCDPVDPEDAHICENFMISKRGDSRFDGVTINGRVFEDSAELAGSWAQVIKLDHPALQSLYKEHGWTGVSMYGPAVVEPISKSTTSFADALAKRLGHNPQGSDTMDETKLAEIVAKAVGAALNPIVEALKPQAPEASTEPAPVAKSEEPKLPAFEGDPNDLEALAKHEEELFKASLDFSNVADIAKWREYVAKRDASADAGDPADQTENAELAKARQEAEQAKARLAQLEKSSKRGTSDVETSASTEETIAKTRSRAREAAQALLVSQGRRKPASN